jgi:Domain of unknown function (DUF4282)
MGEFASFRKFITPVVIQIVFWIGVVVIVIGTLVGIFGGEHLGSTAGPVVGPILSILGGIVFLFVWRMWCELIILSFKIYDELCMIASNTRRQG